MSIPQNIYPFSQDITYEGANKLVYLDMCIQEALRMYPPAFRFDRTAAEDIVIDGITITKGTSVGFPAYAVRNLDLFLLSFVYLNDEHVWYSGIHCKKIM
jgi:hypothetical protein